jgi:hypothetical protein
MTFIERTVNTETNEITEKAYNAKQLAEVKVWAEEAAKIAADKLAAQTAKETAQEKLAALGLTVEDLKALGL